MASYRAEDFDFNVWNLEGKPVAGRFKLPEDTPPDVSPHVRVYFVVGDCDDAVATLRKLGGEVRTGPRDSPYGRFAAVTDGQGAGFSLIDPAPGWASRRSSWSARVVAPVPGRNP